MAKANIDIDSFLKNVDVSRETKEKLYHYQSLLHKWQKAINLVSKSTLNASEKRHFLDSYQLLDYIVRDVNSLVDFGSGAGFPGLVLAICRPDLDVHLVESDQRKCTFLQTVSRETHATNVTIHNQRIEELAPFKVDLCTARALKELDQLLAFSKPFAPEQCLFLKGETYALEVERARQAGWRFDLNTYQSVTNKQAKILELTNIKAA